jgi:hypothetical protein
MERRGAVRFTLVDRRASGEELRDGLYVPLLSRHEERRAAVRSQRCVDGRARTACLKTAVNRLALNGILVLDNSDRPYKQEIIVPKQNL